MRKADADGWGRQKRRTLLIPAAAEFQVEGKLFVGQLLEENRKLCLMGPCITGKLSFLMGLCRRESYILS